MNDHWKPHESWEIDVVDGLSFEDFFVKYMNRNIPVIIKNITSKWNATKDWTKDGKVPDFAFLKQKFGHLKAPVVKCSSEKYGDEDRDNTLVEEFIDRWNEKTELESNLESPLYLKDWHLCRDLPEYSAYNVPKYFHDDWLDEYSANSSTDDFKFVYMGSKGTWTPLHHDVFKSYSWSANIVGRKKWILFPPSEEKGLKDKWERFTVTDVNDPTIDKDIFPLFDTTLRFEVIQEVGEVIFIPSGWYHQVHNLEDTISINQNWFNACNLLDVVNYVLHETYLTRLEIRDCVPDIYQTAYDSQHKVHSNWETECQFILKANIGMDLSILHDLLYRKGCSLLQLIEMILPGKKSTSTITTATGTSCDSKVLLLDLMATVDSSTLYKNISSIIDDDLDCMNENLISNDAFENVDCGGECEDEAVIRNDEMALISYRYLFEEAKQRCRSEVTNINSTAIRSTYTSVLKLKIFSLCQIYKSLILLNNDPFMKFVKHKNKEEYRTLLETGSFNCILDIEKLLIRIFGF